MQESSIQETPTAAQVAQENPQSKSLRTRCSLWATWKRADFISALQAVYPQISHDIDKTYLGMITDLMFVYDINNPLVEQYFSDQIAKIDQHYNV